MNNTQINKELQKIQYEIDTLNNDLIKALNNSGIELIDLYFFINTLDVLKARKNKLMYLKATNI